MFRMIRTIDINYFFLLNIIIQLLFLTRSSPRRCPGVSWTLVVNSLEAVRSFPFITSAINCCRRYIRGYGTVAWLSTIPHCWFYADMSHVPVAWQRPGCNIHISSDISALWAECHVSHCLYSSLYL
jgi:hypothetical protein